MQSDSKAAIKDQSKTGKLSDKLRDYIKELITNCDRDYNDTQQWRDKMLTAANQRLGIAEISSLPYENAPSIPLPETDKLIRKAVPNMVLAMWSPKKLCTVGIEEGTQVKPEDEQRAKKCEAVMNMLLRNKMNLYDKLELSADNAKEMGISIARVVEEYKTRIVHKVLDLKDYPKEQLQELKQLKNAELKQFLIDRYEFDPEDDFDKEQCKKIIDDFRKGKKVIEFDIEEISSLPMIEIVNPTKITVPVYTTDIEDSYRLRYDYELTRPEIEGLMDAGVFIKKDLDALDFNAKDSPTDDMNTLNQRRNEGVITNSDDKDLYRLQEIEALYKPEGADLYERWVFTIFAGVSDPETALLQRIAFPFEFEGLNYVRYDNERKNPGHYNSRGVPEQIQAIQEVMDQSLDNMLQRDAINNNPSYKVLDTSEILQRDSAIQDGELIPVSDMNEIQPLTQMSNVDMSSERIIQMLKATVEEYMGNTDQLFNNATNTGGGKTLGEIQEGLRQTAGPINIEIIRWNEFWTKVYRMVFNILKERLGQSIWIDGQEVTREDFNFNADVKANGSLEVADKRLLTQKAWMRLQAIANFVQAGVVNQEDVFNALQDWLEKDGVKDPEKFSTHPNEILKTQLAQMQQQVQQLTQQTQQLQEANVNGMKDLAKTKKSIVKEQIDNIAEFESKKEQISTRKM
ncbi:MAG: hypothetical protein U9O94_02220 [Nanoarchaeota archaeon]|nr:hypothetical protein [Nanoarchaeota archaeon]